MTEVTQQQQQYMPGTVLSIHLYLPCLQYTSKLYTFCAQKFSLFTCDISDVLHVCSQVPTYDHFKRKQLILKQHRFKLCTFTQMQIFFNSYYDLWLVESRYRGRGWASLTPVLFKGQMYITQFYRMKTPIRRQQEISGASRSAANEQTPNSCCLTSCLQNHTRSTKNNFQYLRNF